MTENQLEEFYNLCQNYRHCPIESPDLVIEAYQALIDFIDNLTKGAMK